jgi:hypothetical protein
LVDPNTPATITGKDLGLKRITVIVTNDTGAQIRLVALRASVGVFEQVPGSVQTHVGWVGFDLQVGDTGKQGSAGSANAHTSQ